jgi:hypothetical protein
MTSANARWFGTPVWLWLGRVISVTKITERFRIVAVGHEQEIAGVAQCLGYLRYRDVAVAIFFVGLFGEIAGCVNRIGERSTDLGQLEENSRRDPCVSRLTASPTS